MSDRVEGNRELRSPGVTRTEGADMKSVLILLALVAGFAVGITPAAQADSAPAVGPDVLLPGDGGPCDPSDVDCVVYWSAWGTSEVTVTSSPDSVGYDLYGYAGNVCRWVSIQDDYYAWPFGYKTVTGILQAYVCRRGGVVSRFDQISAFAVSHIKWPDSMVYHLDWSIPSVDEMPKVPVKDTSFGATVMMRVCAWFKPICSNPRYPRYTIYANGSRFYCTVNGYAYPDCVGHRWGG